MSPASLIVAPVFPVVLLILSALCFAGAWVAGKVAVQTMPPLALAVGRFVIASVLLWGWTWWRGSARWPARGDLPLIGAMGFTAVAGYNILFFYGLQRAPASDGAIIVPGLAPVFALVLGRVFLRERMAASAAVGLLLALGGLVFIMMPSGEATGSRLVGDSLFVLGALAWGIYTVLGKSATARFDSARATLYATISGTVMLLPPALIENGWSRMLAAPSDAWAGLVYLGVFATVVSFAFLYEGVKRVGAARASTSLFLIPVFGVLLSAVFLDERIGARVLVGGAMVIAGLVFVNRPRRALAARARGAA